LDLLSAKKNAADARVSFVALASGGKRLLEERIEKAELLSEEVISPALGKKVEALSDILDEIKKTGV
jgi:DNA-binding MarR family transcriptional regulator